MSAERAAWRLGPALLAAACAGGADKAGGDNAAGARSFVEAPLLEDLDPSPGRFAGAVRAAAAVLPLDGEDVERLAYNNSVPGPRIEVALGDGLVLNFENDLPDGEDWASGVHWHGIEGFNTADGTPVTEAPVPPGGSRAYAFTATRPGVFWYHPHMRGAQALFSGLYGPLIVADPDEALLVADGVLPAARHVVVLSDTHTVLGQVASAEVDNPMEIMNGTEGSQLLVNGAVLPTLEVPLDGGVRLQLINASITRFWRLAVPGRSLVRVGGEGGLLDRARVEGGTVTGQRIGPGGEDLGAVEVPLRFDVGEVLLAPGERADVVLLTHGAPGDELALEWRDSARGRHDMWMEGDEMVMGDAADDGTRPAVQVAKLRLVDTGAQSFEIDDGAPLLDALGRSVSVAPAAAGPHWTGVDAVSLDEEMDHVQLPDGSWEMTTWFGIDGESWHPHRMGDEEPALAPSARRARLGETIELEVRNNSMMSHPYHLHGFSFQVIDWTLGPEGEAHEGGETAEDELIRVTADHAEWQDTVLLPPWSSVRLRVPLFDPGGGGQAAGRWMQHCHILQHGENGMMSELVVEP
ncbi:MAG: multicopper oxidase family protein [Deltaproteobacteria bacterium]|nr:multicopper oxidase family protein [Deltaproteobacteria bacterium]